MFREDIKTFSSYDLLEDIKLISQEVINRTDNEDDKVLMFEIKKLVDKMLTKVVA